MVNWRTRSRTGRRGWQSKRFDSPNFPTFPSFSLLLLECLLFTVAFPWKKNTSPCTLFAWLSPRKDIYDFVDQRPVDVSFGRWLASMAQVVRMLRSVTKANLVDKPKKEQLRAVGFFLGGWWVRFLKCFEDKGLAVAFLFGLQWAYGLWVRHFKGTFQILSLCSEHDSIEIFQSNCWVKISNHPAVSPLSQPFDPAAGIFSSDFLKGPLGTLRV